MRRRQRETWEGQEGGEGEGRRGVRGGLRGLWCTGAPALPCTGGIATPVLLQTSATSLTPDSPNRSAQSLTHLGLLHRALNGVLLPLRRFGAGAQGRRGHEERQFPLRVLVGGGQKRGLAVLCCAAGRGGLEAG